MHVVKKIVAASRFKIVARSGAICVLLCLLGFSSFAQYFHFTQYQYTPMRLNPALVGTHREAQALFHFRQQATNTDVQFRTSMLMASYPLLQRGSGRQYGGVGISVMDDRTGTGGMFTFQTIGLNGAYNVALQENQGLVLGFQGNYSFKGISVDGLTTGSQYLSDRGYAPDADLGENFDNFRSRYFSLSTGLYWYTADEYDQRKAYAGISLFDFNRPGESFITASAVPASLIVHAGYRILDKNTITVTPELLYSLSAGTNYFNLGALLSYHLGDDRTSHLDFSAHYVAGQAANVGVQLIQPNYILGFSYDLPLNQSTPNTYRSATEFLLALKMPVKAGDKKKKNKKKVKKKKRKKKKTARKQKTKKPVVAKKKAPAPGRQPDTGKAQPQKELTPADTTTTSPPVVANPFDSTEKKVPELNGYISVLNENNAIQFKFNSEELNETSYPYLDELAAALLEHTSYQLLIVGHTDDVGSATYNLSLSKRRAQQVADYLQHKGIASKRLIMDGKGESQPLVPNTSEAQRARNRRVELLIYQE